MDKKTIREWGKKLDEGALTDPTLELARKLENLKFADYEYPENEKRAFLDQIATKERKGQSRLLQKKKIVLIAGPLVLFLAFMVLFFQPASRVSAADILLDANAAYEALFQEEGILYKKFQLQINAKALDTQLPSSTTGQIWRSNESGHLRYTLSDQAGSLLYFSQADDAYYWRSAHPCPVGCGAVETLYRLPYDEYNKTIDDKSRSQAPIFGDLVHWIEIDQWFFGQPSFCEDLFCLLRLGDRANWNCDETQCELTLLPQENGTPAVKIIAKVTGKEQSAGGKSVTVMEFRTSHDNRLVRTLKFDDQTDELVDLIAYSDGEEIAHLAYLDQRILTGENEMDEPFNAIPDNLKIIVLENAADLPDISLANTPTFDPPAGSFVYVVPNIEEITPQSGTRLEGLSEFSLTIQYKSGVPNEGSLTVHICAKSPGNISIQDDCAHLPSTAITIQKYTNTYHISFTVEPDDTWPDEITVALVTRLDNDRSIITHDPELFWMLRP